MLSRSMPRIRGTPTRMDVAREAGVSLTTAALALNSHPRVSVRTRQRVMDAATRLGFVANYAARRLARSQVLGRAAAFEQIGFMYVTSGGFTPDQACIAMMHGAAQELSRAGACLMFVPVEQRDWDRVERLVRSGLVDGWLLSGSVDDEAVMRLKRLRVPHVIVGERRCTQPVHSVEIDHFQTGHMAAEYLVELGHRRIAFMGGSLEFAYQIRALDGFRAGMRGRGIEFDDRLFIKGRQLKSRLHEMTELPTAIFSTESAGDSIRQVMNDLHIEVPRQMSIMACEYASSPTIVPDLSRIELPLDDLGRQGARLLHRVVTEPYLGSSELKLFGKLVEGGSTSQLLHEEAT